MAGFIRSMGPCDSYLKDQGYVAEILHNMGTTCGCNQSKPMCRDLKVVQIHNPLWPYRFTCKETATAGCKSAAKLVPTIWIKVPPKDNKECFNAYKETEILATSCN